MKNKTHFKGFEKGEEITVTYRNTKSNKDVEFTAIIKDFISGETIVKRKKDGKVFNLDKQGNIYETGFGLNKIGTNTNICGIYV